MLFRSNDTATTEIYTHSDTLSLHDALPVFPSGAPTFRSYVGTFEYTTPTGTLTMREMGLSEPSLNTTPEGGVVNAFQRIVGGTGEFAGATGYLFVSGFNRSGQVATTVHGEICRAAPVP